MKIKSVAVIIFAVGILFSCTKNYQSRIINTIAIEGIKMDSASIRAIDVLKDSTLIFATSNGLVGMVYKFKNEPLTIEAQFDTITPHFRSIASNGEYTFALSIGNPALLYKLNDGNLELVYKEEHEKVFYDAMTFFDNQNGIAMGDPTDGCLSVIITKDGGNTWNKLSCEALPPLEEGEAAFAASNTNIATIGSNAWIVTGGKRARVFHTSDMGKTWEVYNTPIIEGETMTGIYSVDFFDAKNGIIMGGDWNKKESNLSNKAITNDGGKTWQLIADGKEPGYKSCVQYVPNTEGKELFAVGSTGISFSNDSGTTWKEVSNEKGYYTIKFVNKNIAWLAGKEKIGKLILE
tara:strand:- start:192058 stop:193104 length:1047 start_codon:yes stop_codon:yes gene_type:complete